ncbi:hypothetical protein QFZ49_004879 [Streptomyces turgidiscabies]|uniref:Uncharacterized protein n=1 Tax=Streptomyces turgidiscabies TaxID=85558 RepID=A0ABU0RSH0_9ACTN|nr:hypothetical protein [Streptomyces turgidiscabies]
MARETPLGGPVHLFDPLTLDESKPVRGCDICGALAGQRREALDPKSPAYDLSHATDLAVEIKRHPHDWKKAQR